MRTMRWGHLAFVTFGWALCIVLVLPVAVIVASAFNAGATPAFPPEGFSLRWFEAFAADQAFIDAAIASLQIAAVAAILSVLVGLPAALWVSRSRSRLGVVMEAFLLSPLMLATIVLGVAILQVLLLLGVPTSPLAVSLGHTVIGTPYVARLVLASLAGTPGECERAARSLGAGPVRAFMSVTLPLARSGVVAGGLFALLVSLDDVNIALFLSDVHTTTLPVRTLSYIEQNADPLASAVSATMVFVVLGFLLIADRVFGIDRMFGLPDADANREGA
jgi:putative spermidine/putrescine transport system permease protein